MEGTYTENGESNSFGTRTRSNIQQGQADLFNGPGFTVHTGPRMPRVKRANLKGLMISNSHVLSPQPTRAIVRTKLKFLFKKQLQKSDVNSLRRMVLPKHHLNQPSFAISKTGKKEAETHLPVLESKEGIIINMMDMDGIHVWCFKFRFWPNNSSRMYVLEYTGEFVSTHSLTAGDYILIYRDDESETYVIEAVKEGDLEMREIFDGIDFSLPILSVIGMSIGYDPSFLDDSPLDYQGESMADFDGPGLASSLVGDTNCNFPADHNLGSNSNLEEIRAKRESYMQSVKKSVYNF